MTYKNDPWHRECFVCTHCEAPLAGQRFTSRDEKPYCADCFGELFAKRCTACTKPITGKSSWKLKLNKFHSNLLFLQASVALASSPSRIVTGIMIVSFVAAANHHLLVVVSSPMKKMTLSVPIVLRQNSWHLKNLQK